MLENYIFEVYCKVRKMADIDYPLLQLMDYWSKYNTLLSDLQSTVNSEDTAGSCHSSNL
jgi:hypothetical protein